MCKLLGKAALESCGVPALCASEEYAGQVSAVGRHDPEQDKENGLDDLLRSFLALFLCVWGCFNNFHFFFLGSEDRMYAGILYCWLQLLPSFPSFLDAYK